MTRRDAALLYRHAANDASRQLVLRLCGRHLAARQRQLAAAVNGKEGGRGNKKETLQANWPEGFSPAEEEPPTDRGRKHYVNARGMRLVI